MRINPDFRKVAILAANEAGKALKKNFRRPTKVNFKKDSSLITGVDLEADEIIKKIIKKNFPSHGIVSEEGGGKSGKDFTWIVDPLDGTTNYVLGLSFFSVSLALLKGREPVLSIVFNPISKEFYLAEKNRGAYLNGKRIMVNKTGNLSKSTLLFNKGKDLKEGLKFLIKLASRVRTTRFFGSANLEVCQVALGKVEGYLACKPAYHDHIAGVLIAKESGAIATDFGRKKYGPCSKNLIVANPKIHSQLLKLIK